MAQDSNGNTLLMCSREVVMESVRDLAESEAMGNLQLTNKQIEDAVDLIMEDDQLWDLIADKAAKHIRAVK